MATDQIGMTFIPSADNQAMGPRQAGLEGAGGSDLAQAFKILSLHLPQFLGAQALAPRRLLTSPGSAALPSGFNPQAAVIQALMQAMGGGGPDATSAGSGAFRDFFRNERAQPYPGGQTPPEPPTTPPVPRVTPGTQPDDGRRPFEPPIPAAPPFDAPSVSRLGPQNRWA